MKWTEHLRAPEVARTSSNAAPSTPYGISTVHQPGYVPMGGTVPVADEEPGRVVQVSNLAGGLATLFGVVAIAATFVPGLPGSQWLWVCGAGSVAVLGGVIALLRRVKGRATNVWTPILGILFGAAAAATAVLGVNTSSLVDSVVPGLVPVASSTPRVLAPKASAEPFVFASNQVLTSDGAVVQQIATALNRTYADGNSTLATGQTWPEKLKFTSSQVLAESGTPIVGVPEGYAFDYTLSADLKSYSLSVTSGDGSESASYYSATNKFSFHCADSDTNCVPTS